MLKLAVETHPDWALWAVRRLPEVLVDHAHLERKAAGAAVRLLFRYPERGVLQAPLAGLAREELSHFEAALEQLSRLGIAFGRQRAAPYAGRLQARVRAREPERLVDLLLCAAVIEARSCERLSLLAAAVDDAELAAFLRTLLASEARHHRLYVDLARECADGAAVEKRLAELLAHEARVVAEAPLGAGRLHAGPIAASP